MPPCNVFVHMFVDKVNAKANGAMVMELSGGPETFAPPDAASAVQNGIVEIGNLLYFALPDPASCINCLAHSEITDQEKRKVGVYDLTNEILEQVNMRFIGQGLPGRPQTVATFFSSKPIEKLDDFVGKGFGVVPTEIPLVTALGGSPAVMGFGEFYTGMERGVIDGFSTAISAIFEWGLLDVTDYVLDEFRQSSGNGFIINLDVWNSLPEEMKDILEEAAIETENEGYPLWEDILTDYRQELLNLGSKFTKFSPEESKKFHEIYKEAVWNDMAEKYPEYTLKFKKLLVP